MSLLSTQYQYELIGVQLDAFAIIKIKCVSQSEYLDDNNLDNFIIYKLCSEFVLPANSTVRTATAAQPRSVRAHQVYSNMITLTQAKHRCMMHR